MKTRASISAVILLCVLAVPLRAETLVKRDCLAEGNEHFLAGELDAGLEAYEAGWKYGRNMDCLKGIAAIHTKRETPEGLTPYIPAIMEAAVNDSHFLVAAFTYSMNLKDEKLFRRCLGLTKQEWLEKSQVMQLGISAGAIMFFGEKKAE